MPHIRHLSDPLISQIAAGEVVERPASVVKELIENALDAGASEVRIELEGGGKRRIRVSDDGSGMDREDALLAFDRHATSKIASFDDLQRIATLGFRGEALSSIAAVARVELSTALEAGEGHRVRIEGGRVRSVEPMARPRGTTVDVASLFFNVPARRKFLKSPQTELRRATEVVQGYALARPDARFAISHEGREVLDTLPTAAAAAGSDGDAGDAAGRGARERIGQIFGPRLAAALAELSGGAGGPVWGFVGDPSTTRGRRYFVFVNRRLLRDRAILATFYRAVRDEWRSDEFPALFLFLDLPAEEVDVNVHPQKAEVRFRDSRLLGEVYERLREALARARGEEEAPLGRPERAPAAPFVWQGLGGRGEGPAAWPGGSAEVREGSTASAGRLAEAVYAPLERRPVPLTGRSGEVRSFRLIGQYKGTLVLLEGPDGLYVVDQHVAHERILYERFRRALAGERPASQGLIEPLVLELSAAELGRLEELTGELEGCGFSIAALSGGSLGVAAVPAVLAPAEAEGLLLTLAREEAGAGDDARALGERLLDSLAASLACRGAIKMHDPLSAEKLEALVAELFAAEQPYACPHGRPIVLKMSDVDLERRFGRR